MTVPAGARRRRSREEGGMDDLWLSLHWTGPIGIGAFLAGLGVLFWGIGQAQGRGKKQ
jgi:hypothetical protein